jgi:hypothetical protein
MKTIIMLKCFLPLIILFTFSVKAQSYRSSLNKTVDVVNGILSQKNQVQFIDHKKNSSYLRIINATILGDVYCPDSLTNDQTIVNQIFNFLKVKAFTIDGNEIKVTGINQSPIGKLTSIRSQDLRSLKKELDALRFICITYAKLNPKFKCD